jgi:alcohol dehydrogenase, propanol-preferring
MDLIFGERKVAGSLTGTPATGDATLRFSALSGVAAMIETVPLEQAAAAYAKMMAGRRSSSDFGRAPAMPIFIRSPLER